jgi:rhamnosyltransferase subunit B
MPGSQPGALTVFVISFGGPGDVHPMIALGQALRQRRHRVIFISNPYFEELARRLDLEFTGFGSAQHLVHSMHGATQRSCGTGPARVPPGRYLAQGLDRWRRRSRGVLGTMRWLYEEIEREHIPGETVLVARGNAFGARIAREKLGIPLATVHLQPAMFRSEYDAPGLPVPDGSGLWRRLARRSLWAAIDMYADWLLLPETNGFRAELGLSPVRRLFSKWIHSPDLVLGLFPDWFAPPQPDWPPATHLLGFPLFDERGMREVSAEFESFMNAGEPPVVFTAGSFHRNSRAFFETSVGVCPRLGIRGLLLSASPGCIPANLPERVLHLPYVPLSTVLSRASAIVHHGGVGTAGLAFAAGTPQLVVPFTDDQSDNAARIERAGAGIRLPLAAFRQEAAPRLKELMGSQRIAEACRSLASRMSERNPLAEATRLIENLVSGVRVG